VELRRVEREVALAGRRDAVRPSSARRDEVSHVLRIAAGHFDELAALWENAHA
jgi:hypothetical protein